MRYCGAGHSGYRLKNGYQSQTAQTLKFLFLRKTLSSISVIYTSRQQKEQCTGHGFITHLPCFFLPLQNQRAIKGISELLPSLSWLPSLCLYCNNIFLGYILQNKIPAEGNDHEHPHVPSCAQVKAFQLKLQFCSGNSKWHHIAELLFISSPITFSKVQNAAPDWSDALRARRGSSTMLCAAAPASFLLIKLVACVHS